MAEGVAEETGRTAGRLVDIADHPLLFALAITFMVISMSALLYWGFVRLGWTGPASLFH